MKNQYPGMGMTSVVIVCYKDDDGKPVVYQVVPSSNIYHFLSFDRIAELMGVPSSSFIDTYCEKVTDIMMKLVEYVQSMDKYKNTLSGLCSSTNGGNAEIPSNLIIHKLITLKRNENGYPILPDPIPLEGWKKLTWDHLFTDYLGQQYQLAYGG